MDVLRRKSCRAILLNPEQEILLLKIENPQARWSGWITPGGGLEEGESEIAGLKRELREELGLVLGPSAVKVWRRFHRFPWNGKMVEQQEVFYLEAVSKIGRSETERKTQDQGGELKRRGGVAAPR